MANFKLTINGEARNVEADPQMPLLWVLRDLVGLTGTKYGCGMAQCGACTVHLNGEPVRACVLPIQAAVDKNITTIEGLSPEGAHPLQRAWSELNVPQCGYCQAGQLMSAAALLEKNKNPDDEAIHEAMRGNICRCGTYVRIKAGIKLAAEKMRG